MAYFVTGATGLHRQLPGGQSPRSAAAPIYVLVREGSLETPRRAARRVGRRRQAGHRDRRRSRQAEPRRQRRRPAQAQGQDRSLLPPRGDLRSAGVGRRPAGRQRRRHAPRRRVRDGDRRRLLPPRELDRRRRPLRGRVPRGHVRGSRRARPSVFPHQARLRRRRAQRMQAAVPHLPARASSSAIRRPARSTRSTGRTTSSSRSRRCARSCRRGCRRSASRAGASTSCRSISSPMRSTTSRTRRASTASAST